MAIRDIRHGGADVDNAPQVVPDVSPAVPRPYCSERGDGLLFEIPDTFAGWWRYRQFLGELERVRRHTGEGYEEFCGFGWRLVPGGMYDNGRWHQEFYH